MTLPKYIVKTPVYQYAKSYYWIEVLEGKYEGLQFNFSKIEVVDEMLDFQYNLLSIPTNIEVDDELKQLIGEILIQIIERGQYELNPK